MVFVIVCGCGVYPASCNGMSFCGKKGSDSSISEINDLGYVKLYKFVGIPMCQHRSLSYVSVCSHPCVSLHSHPYVSLCIHPCVSVRSHPYVSLRSHPYVSLHSHLYVSLRSHLCHYLAIPMCQFAAIPVCHFTVIYVSLRIHPYGNVCHVLIAAFYSFVLVTSLYTVQRFPRASSRNVWCWLSPSQPLHKTVGVLAQVGHDNISLSLSVNVISMRTLVWLPGLNMNIALFEVGLYWMLVAVITGSSSGWGRWVLHLRSLVNILIWGNGDWNEVEKLKYAINLKKKQLSLLACHEVTVCAMKIQLVPWGFCLDCLINHLECDNSIRKYD